MILLDRMVLKNKKFNTAANLKLNQKLKTTLFTINVGVLIQFFDYLKEYCGLTKPGSNEVQNITGVMSLSLS